MSTVTGLAKCSCSHCGGHLEFDAAYAGERVACPHCGNETFLDTLEGPPAQPLPCPSRPIGELCGPQAPVPIITAPRPPNAPRQEIFPAPDAAKASWVAFLFAYGFSAVFGRGLDPEWPIFGVTEALFVVIGLTFGIIGVCGVRKYGSRGILIPSIVGIILNGLALLTVVFGLQMAP